MTPQEIRARQNRESALRLQAAVRIKASQSKDVRRAAWVVTWGLVLAGPITYLLDSDNSDLIGAAAAGWLLVTRLVVDRLETTWRLQSAYLAERHDCLVLGVPQRQCVLSGRVTEEEANAAADRYIARRSFAARLSRRVDTDPFMLLRDWFAVPDGLNDDALVLGCQRSGAEYARRMAQEWALICQVVAAVLVVGFIGIALASDMSLADYLVHFALPTVPAVVGLVDAAQLHQKGARLRAQIVDRAESAIASRVVTPISPTLTRELADLAWEIRRSGPGAPDLFYRLRRRSLEVDSAAASAQLT